MAQAEKPQAVTQPLLDVRHEQFCVNIAKGMGISESYIDAGYSKKAAAAGAAHLAKRDQVAGRILFLRRLYGHLAEKCSIREVDERIKAAQYRWDQLKQIIAERSVAPEFQQVPGGKTGLLYIDYRGKNADIPVYKVDINLLTALLQHEERAARELGQWTTEQQQGTTNIQVNVGFVSADGGKRLVP